MVLRTFTHDRQRLRNVQHEQRRYSMNPTHASLLTWHAIALVYYCYTTLISSALPTAAGRLVDLTHTFDETTISWVMSKKLNFTVTHNGTYPGKDYWYQADEISAGTHVGTHMDSPCHYAVGHWCVSDIPVERLVVWAAVIDISKYVGDDPDVHLSDAHLKEWEEMNGRIPDNSLLLIRTGWSRFWPDREMYIGTEGQNKSYLKFPSIRPEAAKWLVDNREIVGVGIDALSIDIPKGRPRTHMTLLEKNIYGLENVNLKEPLPPTGVKVYVMPMKLKGASGASCRIVAEVFENFVSDGNVSSQISITLIWTMAIIAAFSAFANGRF